MKYKEYKEYTPAPPYPVAGPIDTTGNLPLDGGPLGAARAVEQGQIETGILMDVSKQSNSPGTL